MSCILRSMMCAFKGKCRTFTSIYFSFEGLIFVVDVKNCDDGRTLQSLAPHLKLGETFDLTSARFTLQSSKFAFPKLFSAPMSSARPNLVLVRPPCSSLQHYNKSSQSQARHPSWLCAIPVSLLTKSRTNMRDSASICQM